VYNRSDYVNYFLPQKKNIYVFQYTVLSALQVWRWNDAAADAALGAPVHP
jgi:hypothetical protein